MMAKDFKPKQTVDDLIKKLQELPQDMPIATYNEPFDYIYTFNGKDMKLLERK